MCVAFAGCGRLGFDPLAGSDGDGGISACPSFALFCDDFESGDLSRWARTSISGTSTVTVAAGVGRTGSFGLDAQNRPNTGGGAASSAVRRAPSATGMIAVRSWNKLMTPLRNYNLVLEFRDRASGDFTTAGGNSVANWVSTEIRAPSSSVIDHASSVPVPNTGTWVCVEMTYTHEPAPGRVQVFVNDAMVLDTPSLGSTAFDEVGVGVIRGDQALGLHVYVDDVVVADRYIGCQ